MYQKLMSKPNMNVNGVRVADWFKHWNLQVTSSTGKLVGEWFCCKLGGKGKAAVEVVLSMHLIICSLRSSMLTSVPQHSFMFSHFNCPKVPTLPSAMQFLGCLSGWPLPVFRGSLPNFDNFFPGNLPWGPPSWCSLIILGGLSGWPLSVS